MWQRFTERARRVVFFAQEESARLGENYVGTEHLLLGLIRDSDNVAVRILERIGVCAEWIRADVVRQVARGHGHLGQEMELTPRSKRVIDLAYEEARALRNNYIGTEHLLLGLIREGDGLAARVLQKAGADHETVMREVLVMQNEKDESSEGGPVEESAAKRMWRLQQMRDAREDPLPQNASEAEGLRWAVTGSANYAKRFAPRWAAELALEISREMCAGLADLRSIGDLTIEQAWALLCLAKVLKETLVADPRAHEAVLPRRTLAMIFEKPSLRTRVSFETGMFQLGGHAIYLQPSDISLGKRESVADVAHNLEHMVDGIMARVFAHSTILELAEHSSVPVVNGLCDREHPCQALADYQTIWEKRGAVAGQRVAYVGDGNNVAHSLLLLGGKLGAHVVVACPEGYDPDAEIVTQATALAAETGGSIAVTHDPREACTGADVVYTDVWASMGQEAETAERAKIFAPYQVNEALVSVAKPDYLFMHCLPAHRGEEVSAGVMDGPNSVVFDQAENRLHAQKAVLAVLMG
jgi:ornithine carbamoyltransferase